MGRWFYTFLYYLITPFVLLRLLYRAQKAPAYAARWHERFGFFSVPELSDTIWVHAVSVGETIAAVPLIKQLQQRYPDYRIVVTTMTPTGSERVKAALGDSVFHVYAPYDLPGAVKRFIKRVRPSMLIVMETELWPNTVHYCRQAGVPVILANGRMSERSANGYARVDWLSKSLFSGLSQVVAQHESDAERFRMLGCPAEQVTISGSIKFDIHIDANVIESGAELRKVLGAERPVWIAASTHEGEDELLLEAHSRIGQVYPEALLLIVPRHPERFNEVYRLCARQFETIRRSEQISPSVSTQVYVGDTMGELLQLYAAADVAFVGGSLVERGGHNPLEPAALGMPILMGPHVFNFEAICHELSANGGLKFVGSAALLAERLQEFFADKTYRKEIGTNALGVVEANRGALDVLLAEIDEVLAQDEF